MEINSGNQLKEYIKREVKEHPMHNNYGHNYYFCRSFLERLSNVDSHFVLSGSLSQLAHIKQFTRPITDLDIICFDPKENCDSIVKKAINSTGKVRFDIKKQSGKDFFETTNNTINYRIMGYFDKVEHLISLDIKQQQLLDNQIKKDMPIIFSKDNIFNVNTVQLEEHLANKLYILLLGLQTYNQDGKDFRRFKDFIDVYSILNKGKIDCLKTIELLLKRTKKEGLLDNVTLNGKLFEESFVKSYSDDWEKTKKQYNFTTSDSFGQIVETTNNIISGNSNIKTR